MPNFLKIFRQMRKFSIRALYSHYSVHMAAICCCGPISTVPTLVVQYSDTLIFAILEIQLCFFNTHDFSVNVY